MIERYCHASLNEVYRYHLFCEPKITTRAKLPHKNNANLKFCGVYLLELDPMLQDLVRLPLVIIKNQSASMRKDRFGTQAKRDLSS